MEVTFERSSLYQAVHAISGALNQRAPKPVLQCIHLEAKQAEVVVSATDLQIAMRYTAPAKKIAKGGTALVHGIRLGALLRDITDENVKLRVTEGRATVTAGRSSFRLVAQEPEEYPTLPEFRKASVVVRAEDIDTVVRRTAFATAQEQGRYAINGVSVVVEDGKIELAATDGRRLAVASAEAKVKGKLESCIAPPKMLSELRRQAAEASEVEVTVAEGKMMARAGRTVVAGMLIEGVFPVYDEMIPKKTKQVFSASAEGLASGIRQAAQLTTEESRAVVMNISPGQIRIEAKSAAIGEALVHVDVSYDGEPVSVALNPQFLLDVLSEFGDAEIALEIGGSDRPVVLRREGFVYVIAPVRVRGGPS
jgi:DNA polymerase-3 subunit beta